MEMSKERGGNRKVLLVDQVPEVNRKYTFSLARALKRQGINITVCGVEEDQSFYQGVEYAPLFLNYSRKNGVLEKIKSYWRSWKSILGYCIKNEIDIVHVQWYIFSPLDWYYHKKLKQKKIKIVTTIHDLLPFNKKFYDYHYHKLIYSHADMVVNQARMNEETLIKNFGVDKEKLIYIPHGHFMEYVEQAGKEESCERLHIDRNRPVILFFGQIKKVKGVDVLIKAMRHVVARYPEVLCIIAGKVWKDDFSVYQESINSLNLSENIRTDIHYIPDEDIKYYFNAADIVALPYRQIYQSGVVQLAYAYEKPVVATTEGEFLTVVKDHETGLLVKSGSDDELADAICWYLEDMNRANEMAKKGKEDLMVRLSWDTIAGEIADIYEKMEY